MASLDYGSGSDVDSFSDYEWSGEHYFTFDSNVILEYSVDITASEQALRAVNAGTVVSYVGDYVAQIFAQGNNVEFNSTVTFMSDVRTYFENNPYLGESLSLWDIDDLATWPDQVQLRTAVSIGDVKDYVDQNLYFAVDYVTNTTKEIVASEISIQLPDAIPVVLNDVLPSILDDYSLSTIFPEVDRRIAAATGSGTGGEGGSGLSEEQVNSLIDARLPVAIEGYMTSNVYPFFDERTQGIVTPLLTTLQNDLRSEFEARIAEALAADQSLTPDEVVALIDSSLPSLIETALESILPEAINTYATPIVESKIAEQLPNAIQEGITSSSETILASLESEIDQSVAEKLATDLPVFVRDEVSLQIPSAVKAHLDLTLDEVVSGYVDAVVPNAVQAEMQANLTAETLWPLLRDPAGNQATSIVEGYLNAETIWPIIQEVSGLQSSEVVATELASVLTEDNIWRLVSGLSETQANGLISAALAGLDLESGSMTAEEIWELINGKLQEAVETTISEAFPSLAQGVLLENLAEAVSAELQLQLPALLPSEIAQVLDAVLPEAVQEQVFTNLQIALAEDGFITAAIETRVDARADTLITEALNGTILPMIGSEVESTANAIIPPIVEQQVADQLETVLPSLVENTVQEALQPELDALVNNTIPNVVNLQMTASLPDMVDQQLTERFGEARPSVYRRYYFETPQQVWVVEHEFIGAPFNERLYNSSGRPMYASIEVVNETSFVVTLTEAMTGWVDVEFHI
tara:strand:+ start:104016 stop:106271 length:2256 start_codon:yes stop_codon:yes gene_type:complete